MGLIRKVIKIKLYTMQKLKAWKKAQQRGYLVGNREYVWENFIDSYSWMRNQMYKRLNKYDGEYPIWLWLETDNINFSEMINEDWVLLEINLSKEDIVLSNFDAWHIVLNNGYFDEEPLTQREKEINWEYIFNRDKLEEWGYSWSTHNLQAVAGRIELENIKVIKYIVDKV